MSTLTTIILVLVLLAAVARALQVVARDGYGDTRGPHRSPPR